MSTILIFGICILFVLFFLKNEVEYNYNDKDSVSSQINKVILSLLMIVLPALVGMYVLADPIYSTFYSRSLINADLLRFY